MRRSASARASGRALLLQLLPQVLALLMLLSLGPMTSSAAKDYTGWRVLRVLPANEDTLSLLEQRVRALGPHAAELWRRRPAADVFVRPDVVVDLLDFLQSQGIPAKVHVTDVGEQIRRELPMQTHRSGGDRPAILHQYLRYEEINDFLADLARRYPRLVTVETFGQSYEGRPMKVIKISTGGGGTRPVILVDAGIHAREWISPAMALYVIQQLVENPNNIDLISNVDWHIIPLLNPDGYEYSHTSNRMWRKTRSRISPGCYGVDPNRNFDFNWGVVGVSWSPCEETYAGSMPFSEVETKAFALYGLTLRDRLRLYVSVHSYGGVLIHPWGYTYAKPPDTPQLMELGNLVARAIKGAGIPHFDVGNCFEMLGELAAGGSDDWMKAEAGANFSYTLEMPVPAFVTPASDIPRYVVPTFEGFRVMGRYIKNLFG